jgi:hypothetical protein
MSRIERNPADECVGASAYTRGHEVGGAASRRLARGAASRIRHRGQPDCRPLQAAAGSGPQPAEPAECDLAIVLLWGRMGTPLTEKKADGTPYLSGTGWEFENALEADKTVLLYRRSRKCCSIRTMWTSRRGWLRSGRQATPFHLPSLSDEDRFGLPFCDQLADVRCRDVRHPPPAERREMLRDPPLDAGEVTLEACRRAPALVPATVHGRCRIREQGCRSRQTAGATAGADAVWDRALRALEDHHRGERE